MLEKKSAADILGPKLVTFDEALSAVRSHSRIVAAMAAAEPRGLLELIGDHCRGLQNVTLHCANPSRDYPCFADVRLSGRLELEVMFLTAKIRARQGHDCVHYVPQHLSQWVKNLTRERQIDVFWGSCTPPDARGFVSLGTGSCFEPEILRMAKKVILEINPKLPVTGGATHVPISWVDQFVMYEHDLPIAELAKITPEDRAIATYVAELVPNGSTIQLGIGAIPNAIGEMLRDKRDLGVHSEMINDAMMRLSLAGVINGRQKTIWPGKIIGSFVFGSAELYDFVHENPAIELQPSSLVNDPLVMGQNHAMISINTAVEVDLTGQVCSESIGHTQLSGVGGAWETHVGAQRSAGGRGVIAIRSTTSDGQTSKIGFELKPGAKVSVSRNDVDTIVTEFGVAQLAGKSVAARARALIQIAHPRFRELLFSQAKKAGYL